MNIENYTIRCRDIRNFIIKNGEIELSEIIKAFPCSGKILSNMVMRNLISVKVRDDGRFYKVIPLRAIRSFEVRADLSFEDED